MNCVRTYEQLYNHPPEAVFFCPYRISPLGAHTDHQYGKINGLAIDRGIHLAYGPKRNGVVELRSLNYPKRAQFHIAEIERQKAGDWGDYLRGAAIELNAKYPLRVGLSGVIEGSLPIGGLSSSAAMIIVFLSALAKVNGIRLEEWETIMMAKAAENNYVGVNCGKLDQACEILCRKDQLLYLDCRDDSYSLLPWSGADFSVAVFFSGLARSLAASAYNLRQDECKAAAYSLLAHAGLPYGKFADTRLRDVPKEVFDAFQDRLPPVFRRRALHFFTELDRAERGAEAWKKGDLNAYGRLVFESGKSSIDNYECGCPELITLYRIMTETDGIYGGRFSGAGFKGCCMALVDPAREEEILEKVGRAYLKAYPRLEGRYSAHICHSADGVRL